jgi:hypothetical protein
MKVTFTYVTQLGGSSTTPIVLSLGQRLSPLEPVQFRHSGAAQESFPARAAAKVYFGRGGASTNERFTAQQEHSSYFAAVTWSRVTLSAARGKQGTLEYQGDTGGRVRLVNCVLTEAAGRLSGNVSYVDFEFVGGTWQSG